MAGKITGFHEESKLIEIKKADVFWPEVWPVENRSKILPFKKYKIKSNIFKLFLLHDEKVWGEDKKNGSEISGSSELHGWEVE